jgi:hypothetical protein
MFSSALVSTSVALALLLGPPVQNPSVSPTQPQPGEPAIAPAQIEGEAAIAEPAPVDPAITPEPQPTEPEPEPEPELPSWQSDPTSVPPPSGDPSNIPSDSALTDDWGRPLPPPEKPIPPKGAAFYIGSGVLFGAMITKQWIMGGLMCDDVYCGYRGNVDRALGLGTMAFAIGGGWFDGRRAAYLRHDAGKPQKPLTGRRAAGWTMFAVGLGGLLADAILYNVCYSSADGPYTKIVGFSYTCSPVTSVVIVDLSTLVGTVGLGLGVSAESQRRHHKKYQMSLAPWGGRGQAGLSISGRF